MKITKVSALVLRLPQVTDACDGTQDTCLIKVETDAGITGWGEVETSPTVAKAAVEALESHELSIGLASAIEGMDPLAVNDCMTRMEMASGYFAGSGSGLHAMAGINVALWDVVGKAYDLPIYRLFGGGSKTKIRAYASTLFGNTPAETYDRASRYADMGFTALKLGWGPMGGSRDGDIALVREGRRGVGEDMDFMIDAGQPWNWRTALDRGAGRGHPVRVACPHGGPCGRRQQPGQDRHRRTRRQLGPGGGGAGPGGGGGARSTRSHLRRNRSGEEQAPLRLQ